MKKKNKKRYHWKQSVPKWYINLFFTRKIRAKTRNVLKKMDLKSGCDDVHIPINKDAGYDYW